MLSDEGVEFTEALDRLSADAVAGDIAAGDLGIDQPLLPNKGMDMRDADTE